MLSQSDNGNRQRKGTGVTTDPENEVSVGSDPGQNIYK